MADKVKKRATTKPAEVIPAADDDAAAAMKQDARIREGCRSIGKKWVEIGLELAEFKAKRRWEPLGFSSLNSWLEDVAGSLGFRRSTFYDLATTMARLKEISVEDLKQMPRENAKEVARLPESKRTPEVIQAAKVRTHREVRRMVDDQTEGAARERNQPWTVYMPESQIRQLEAETLPVATWLAETDVKSELLEFIVSEFLHAPCGHPDARAGESNLAAYLRLNTPPGPEAA